MSDFKSSMTKSRTHNASGKACHSKTRVYVFPGVISREELGFDRQWHARAVEGHARLPVSLIAGTLKLIDLAAAVIP